MASLNHIRRQRWHEVLVPVPQRSALDEWCERWQDDWRKIARLAGLVVVTEQDAWRGAEVVLDYLDRGCNEEAHLALDGLSAELWLALSERRVRNVAWVAALMSSLEQVFRERKFARWYS